MALPNYLRWCLMNLLWGLWMQKITHFFFRRFNSLQNTSNPTGEEYQSKGKVVMSSFKNNIISPPLSFRSILCTVEYPWMKNWFVEKVRSNFVSLIMRIYIVPPMRDESNSNLFLMEFILRYPATILLEYLARRSFSPKIISCWCSSGTEFIEIISGSDLWLS